MTGGPERRHIAFELAGATARARLLDEEAPVTCAALWERLPIEGTAGHSMISGTIAGIYLSPILSLPPENATNVVETGDVMFSCIAAGVRHCHPEPLSEILWAYDRYCRPTVAATMTPMTPSIVGRLVGDCDRFFAMCRRLRDEGRKPLRITRCAG